MTPAAAVVLLAVALQAAGQEGTVSGSLTVSGRTVSLVHVYASAQPGAFGKTKEDVRVLLSDTPLNDRVRSDVFELIRLAREGRASIAELVIDADGSVISGAFFLREFEGMLSATGMHQLRRDELGRGRIAGRLFMERDRTIGGITLQYTATFSAPIPRPPTAEERALALESPAARTAAAYLSAIKAGNMAGLLETLSIAAAGDFNGDAGRERLRNLRAEMPADSRVVDLTPQTNGSIIVSIEGHEGTVIIEYLLTLVREAGEWKVGK